MTYFGSNLKRLMARAGLTVEQVVESSGLNARTVKSLLKDNGVSPQSRTLHKLANGLGVPADEFFQNPSLLAARQFDRETNPLVEQVAGEHPQLFEGWSQHDFDELYGRLGMGGALTADGALAACRWLVREDRGPGLHPFDAVVDELLGAPPVRATALASAWPL